MRLAYLSDWKRWPCEEAQQEEIFAKEFAALGHRVHFAFFVPDLPEAERRETWHGQPVTLFRRDRGQYGRLSRWLSDLLLTGAVDAVQVRNDPGYASLAHGLARKHRVPFVFHLSILNGPVLVEEASEEPFPRSWLQRVKGLVGGRLVDRVARSCDLLLPISEAMAAHYAGLGRTGPSVALPMGCRGAAAWPAPGPRDFVEALYVGSLDRNRRLDFLLRALARARVAQPRLRLSFLGSARRPASLDFLRARTKALGLEEAVRFEEPVPRAAVPGRIAAADFCVSPVPPTPYFLLSSPTKLMESLGVGRPAVANDIPDQAVLLADSGGGLCVSYEEAAFGDAMAALAADPARREEMGRRGAAHMAAHRDYGLLARRALAAYARVGVKA
ncbi:MAG: glycosyltransferase [Elusimicrobiota bacterium]|nr:glycosyltransferase [Elusimicrobiota bacterium]